MSPVPYRMSYRPGFPDVSDLTESLMYLHDFVLLKFLVTRRVTNNRMYLVLLPGL